MENQSVWLFCRASKRQEAITYHERDHSMRGGEHIKKRYDSSSRVLTSDHKRWRQFIMMQHSGETSKFCNILYPEF